MPLPIRARRRRRLLREVALADKVATKLLAGGRRHASGASVSLEPVRLLGRRGVEELFVDPVLACGTWALGGGLARGASVDEGCALAVLIDMLEIDDQGVGIVLCVGEDFCGVEGDDVIRDGGDRLGRKVVVIDSEVAVEPVYFIGHELARNEALQSTKRSGEDGRCKRVIETEKARVPWNSMATWQISAHKDASKWSHLRSCYTQSGPERWSLFREASARGTSGRPRTHGKEHHTSCGLEISFT